VEIDATIQFDGRNTEPCKQTLVNYRIEIMQNAQFIAIPRNISKNICAILGIATSIFILCTENLSDVTY